MHLAASGRVRARWTDAIEEEWIRSLLAYRPDLTRAQDEFVAGLFVTDTHAFATAVRNRWRLLKNPPVTVAALLDTLQRQGLSRTVERLKGVVDRL